MGKLQRSTNLNNGFKLTVFVIFIIFGGCSRKDTFILAGEDSVVRNTIEMNHSEKSIESENKPLVTVSRDDEVRIMVRADGAPGMYLGDDGGFYGFYVDLERMVMDEMGQKYKFISYTDVGPVVQAMKIGISHIALATPDVPDYRVLGNLSVPFETLNFVTFVRKDNKTIKGSTKEDILRNFRGKRIGVQTQGHIYQMLRNIKDIELVDYPTTTKAMEALNQGLVDAVPENKETGNYYIKANKWNLKILDTVLLSYKTTTGFSKLYDKDLVERYNNALQTLLDNGSVQRLRERYYGDAAEEYKP